MNLTVDINPACLRFRLVGDSPEILHVDTYPTTNHHEYLDAGLFVFLSDLNDLYELLEYAVEHVLVIP
jgi:hypothetical protein